jgi:hypothetical protein
MSCANLECPYLDHPAELSSFFIVQLVEQMRGMFLFIVVVATRKVISSI